MEKKLTIRAENLVKSYTIKSNKITSVLMGISLEISKGEFVAVMGPSGVGKSTLLQLLGCLDTPDEGKVELYVDGKVYNYSKLSSEESAMIRNRNIGFVFQFHHLLPEFTSLENVMIPALIAGKSFNEAKSKANDLLKIVGISDRLDHKPSELSGGEQQRIAIARALINEPSIVFADEPTGNLDKNNADAFLELIGELRKKYSLTFIVATHSADVANIAERIIKMRDGKII